MKKVILDTNFLMIPGTLKVDIFSEIRRIMDEPYELCVLDKTLDELEKIMAEQSGKHKLAARLAKSLILHNRLVVLQTTGTSSKTSLVDDYLISFSGKDTIIATQDANLKKHVAEKGGRLIILRNKDHLEIK